MFLFQPHEEVHCNKNNQNKKARYMNTVLNAKMFNINYNFKK